MSVGSETSIIWIPSVYEATPTYVLEFMVNEVIPNAPLRLCVVSSVRESVADMLSGSETSIIWIPSSFCAATATYVLEFMVNEVIPAAPAS